MVLPRTAVDWSRQHRVMEWDWSGLDDQDPPQDPPAPIAPRARPDARPGPESSGSCRPGGEGRAGRGCGGGSACPPPPRLDCGSGPARHPGDASGRRHGPHPDDEGARRGATAGATPTGHGSRPGPTPAGPTPAGQHRSDEGVALAALPALRAAPHPDDASARGPAASLAGVHSGGRPVCKAGKGPAGRAGTDVSKADGTAVRLGMCGGR
jgi:hypothetical protein